MSEINNNTKEEAQNLPEEWMIRPYYAYEAEYQDCTSLKARFNQYFIFGKTLDCKQWKRDADNCYKWKQNNDLKAGKELIESEKLRRKERLKPHYMNDVWMKRKSPPENWNAPLPDYLQEEYKYTYLNVKAQEIKGEIPPSFDPSFSCSVM